MSNSDNNTYWAALPPTDLAEKAVGKVQSYYDFTRRYGFLDRWTRSYLMYYGLSENGSDTTKIGQAGTNGENYIVKINHYRALLSNLLVLITQNPPAMQPKAINTDSKSMGQTVLCRSILDYYMREEKMESCVARAAEFCLYAGEGFVTETWNANRGKVFQVNPETGRPIFDGDAEFRSFHPIDIIRQCNTDSNEPSSWYIVREFKNKFDLAATFPEHAEEIISMNPSPDFFSKYHYVSFDSKDSDEIPVYTLYHEESETLPNGRQFQFLDSDLWLTDGPLAYKHLPVHRIAASNWDGSPFGFTVGYSLMVLQKYLDSLQSMVATNQLNYGTQNIYATRGMDISVTALAEGLNLIEGNPSDRPPQPLNLLQTPKEIFEEIRFVISQMETLSGINQTARGTIDRDLSGSALALLAAQALQFNSGLQRSYNNLLQDCGTGLIEILQLYATTPRLVAIAGRSNRSRTQEFKGSDLEGISRVVCDQVNPLSKSASGRMTMAKDMLESKMITVPQHYFEVIETGNFESLIEHETSQMLQIRSENEDLADGKACIAVLTDQHILHIKEHSTVLDSPDARKNPLIVQETTAHIQQHFQILKSADPQLLIALGQAPIVQQPSLPPPTQQQPPKDSGINPGNLNSEHPQIRDAEKVAQPRMPSMPNGSPVALQNNYADEYQQFKNN